MLSSKRFCLELTIIINIVHRQCKYVTQHAVLYLRPTQNKICNTILHRLNKKYKIRNV